MRPVGLASFLRGASSGSGSRSRSSSLGGGGGASGSFLFGASSLGVSAGGGSSLFGSSLAGGGSSRAGGGAADSSPIALFSALKTASSVLSGRSLPEYVKLFFSFGAPGLLAT